jgi:hypothetical protein
MEDYPSEQTKTMHVPYRPSKIKTPAAMARMLKTTLRPPRAATNGIRPVKISQIANKIIPTFCVILMVFISLLFYATNSANGSVIWEVYCLAHWPVLKDPLGAFRVGAAQGA